MDGSAYGSSGRIYQKQIDQLQQSRQSNSPHHHARLAAAAARTAMVSGANSVSGSTESLNYGSTGSLANISTAGGGGTVSFSDKASQWTILDLGGMHIKNLSSSLFQYTFLTTLYLNHNNLTYLSHHISKLRCLTCLDLSGNKLPAVPPDLGLIISLKELLLFDNALTFLPPELGSLYQAGFLNIKNVNDTF